MTGVQTCALPISTLGAHGRQILDCASSQFLDLATARRLETIDERYLVSLLAKAEGLGYSGTDAVGHDETVHAIQDAHDPLTTRPAS